MANLKYHGRNIEVEDSLAAFAKKMDQNFSDEMLVNYYAGTAFRAKSADDILKYTDKEISQAIEGEIKDTMDLYGIKV